MCQGVPHARARTRSVQQHCRGRGGHHAGREGGRGRARETMETMETDHAKDGGDEVEWRGEGEQHGERLDDVIRFRGVGRRLEVDARQEGAVRGAERVLR
jgi:hypothetical protein